MAFSPPLADTDPWLLVIDAQRIFAAPDSPWGSAMFPAIVEPVRRLAKQAGERTLLTRWVAARPAEGSWIPYFQEWEFADKPADDPLFDLVEEVDDLGSQVITATTFSKWVPDLIAVTGEVPQLILTGVSTDCCVISTALAAADAGATVTVVTDACAGSTKENHEAALAIMGLYPPQITLATSAQVLR